MRYRIKTSEHEERDFAALREERSDARDFHSEESYFVPQPPREED